MRLFFTGIKHSGKTTFARRSAERLCLPWADSDDLILSLISPLSVREYYKVYGKEQFANTELEAVEKYLETNSDTLLSLGGGVADNAELMDLIKKSGKLIYLSREEAVLLRRILLKSGVPAFLDPDDVEGSFHTLFERRDGIYRRYADLVIELGEYSDKEETENYIFSRLKEVL